MITPGGPVNLFNSFMDPEDEWKHPEWTPVDRLFHGIEASLYEPGVTPDYVFYDIGQPLKVYLKNGNVVAGYYIGYKHCGETMEIASLWLRHALPHYWNDENIPNSTILYYRKLAIGERTICRPEKAESAINDYIPKRSIIEIETPRKSMVGFVGRASGGTLDLAQTAYADGTYDDWFNHALSRAWMKERDERKLGLPNDVVIAISIFKEE